LYPGQGATSFANQTVEIGPDMAEFLPDIDDGLMIVRVNAQTGAETVGVSQFISFSFLNETDDIIGTSVQDPIYLYGKGFWGPFTYAAPVPPLTRKIKLQLNTLNKSDNARARGVWDDIAFRMFEES